MIVVKWANKNVRFPSINMYDMSDLLYKNKLFGCLCVLTIIRFQTHSFEIPWSGNDVNVSILVEFKNYLQKRIEA